MLPGDSESNLGVQNFVSYTHLAVQKAEDMPTPVLEDGSTVSQTNPNSESKPFSFPTPSPNVKPTLLCGLDDAYLPSPLNLVDDCRRSAVQKPIFPGRIKAVDYFWRYETVS